ncbi:hypothetical protein Leryth_019859 [Lithospermum erythrorhizon]|nr:hypothetical protein Leryth_019859 [Lithospermum erythrorhizon]
MKTINYCFPLTIILLNFSLISLSNALFPPNPTSSDSICNITPYPKFCKSALPQNRSTTIYDCGRLSLQRSLANSRTLLSFINKKLSQNRNNLALQDCQSLLSTNLDFLSEAAETIKSSNKLAGSRSVDIETVISATLTNIQTCLESLNELSSPVLNEISPALTNSSMSCSVSLALFKNGFVSDDSTKRGRRLLDTRRRLLEFTPPSGVNITTLVVVNPDGSGNYTTINDAINAAPNNTKAGKGYYAIHVVAGVYEENVLIATNKKYLMMIGDGINQTIITGNRSVNDGWTTFNSATFAVTGTAFVAMNITFRNTAGAIKHQAVAMRSGADLSAFYSCSFEAYQDTLYTHSLRQFYKDCDIYGTVDFIFGNAAVVLQSCNIYPRLPMQGQFNAITAQGRTDINQNTGTSIQDCTIKAADDLASSNVTTRTYLGRPWKEYSRTVFMQSSMDSLIDPAGWREWSGDFALSTLYYAEFNNTGPGSNTSSRVTWPGYQVINETDAANFTVSSFLAGEFWLPATGVPFTSGLL